MQFHSTASRRAAPWLGGTDQRETLRRQPARCFADARGKTTISFDPNCRPGRVTDKSRYLANVEQFVAASDIIRMSDADFDYLYGGDDYATKARAMLAAGAKLVVVTCGERGALGLARRVLMPSRLRLLPTRVADTVGAGDSFQAALLFALRELGRIKRDGLAQATQGELRRALSFAAACAAVTCSRAGANPPRLIEVEQALAVLRSAVSV